MTEEIRNNDSMKKEGHAPIRYYIIAGEASGDLHGANLMKGLLKNDPDCRIRFWGGDKMAEVGGTMVRDYKENAVMGIIEVFSRLGSILKNIEFCKKDITTYNPDAVILIDYPGFNLKMAKFAHKKGFKVFYYIPPKVWARGEKRIAKLKKYVDKVFIIFPFEKEYFHSKGIDAIYNGNPLTDNILSAPSLQTDKDKFLQSHGLQPDSREIIALLAGSRKMEVKYLLPKMIVTKRLLEKAHPGRYRFILAAAPSIEDSMYEKYIAGSGTEIIRNDTYGVLYHSRAAIISSGTASLEAAIIGTPQVVCYGLNPISFAIGKLIVKLDTVSLANMILGKHIFKELLQNDCTPENIAAEILEIDGNESYRQQMIADYNDMMTKLSGSGAAERTAKDIESLIK